MSLAREQARLIGILTRHLAVLVIAIMLMMPTLLIRHAQERPGAEILILTQTLTLQILEHGNMLPQQTMGFLLQTLEVEWVQHQGFLLVKGHWHKESAQTGTPLVRFIHMLTEGA
jgi:hypothetical protein